MPAGLRAPGCRRRRQHDSIDLRWQRHDDRNVCFPGSSYGGRHGQFPEYHTSGDDLAFVAPERLELLEFLPLRQYLELHNRVDILLDTYPVNGHTITCNALWMGVPVLTLSGRSFASRVCGSLVRAAGLSNLVCDTPEDYVARAVALAGNPAEVEGYKATLRANRGTCTLFATDRLVSSVEALYRTMLEAA